MSRTFGLVSFAITVIAFASPALAQQQPAGFNRVTTVRREVTARPAQAGQNAARSLTQTASRQGNSTRLDSTRAQAASSSAHPNSSWNQEPRRALPPVPTQATTTPHSYYPNLRAGQSVNRNVATHRCTQSRAGFLTSGGMNSGLSPRGVSSSMNSNPLPRGVHR